MKSRVLHAKDFRSIDIKPYVKPFVPDEEALEGELRRLANPHVRWEAGTAVSSGDQVLCALRSGCPRFNRENVRFVAGSSMFHKELEALSIGMSTGETREIDLPEGRVSLTVRSVMNRVVPELTDAMAEALGLEGVSNLEEYRAYLLVQQKERYLEQAVWEPFQHLRERMLAETEFVLFKEDWQAGMRQKLERCRVLFRQEGIVMEEATERDFEGRIPVKSYHELVAMLQRDEWDTLLMHLLGKYYAQSDGFTVTEADYEQYIADYTKMWHTTEDKAREVDPYDSFVYNEYASHAVHILREYAKTQF